MILRIDWGEDYMKNYKRNDNPFEILRNAFPLFVNVDSNSYILKDVTVDDLEELRETGAFDRELMTCKPVINRDKEGYIKLFMELVKNSNNLLCGVFHEDEYGAHIIGRLSFYDYNPRNLSIEMGYMLHDAWRGKGIMRKCMVLIIKMLFANSDINKIYAQTCEVNTSSRKLLEYCGFSIDAKLREHHNYKGILYDDYIYSLLKSDIDKLEVFIQ